MKPDPAAISAEATRFVSTLVEINHEITSILDLDELLQKIAELTNRIVAFEVFAIFLVDTEKQELYLRFAIGHPPDVVKNLRIKIGDGVTGTAAMQRTIVVVDDVRTYPRYIEAVKNIRSELAVPLISQNRVVGVLDIQSPEPRYFREDQGRLRPTFVIRSNERENQKLVLPVGTGLIGTAAKLNTPLRIADVTKEPRYLNVHTETRSELVVPLTWKGKVVGVADLESTQVN